MTTECIGWAIGRQLMTTCLLLCTQQKMLYCGYYIYIQFYIQMNMVLYKRHLLQETRVPYNIKKYFCTFVMSY